MSCCGGKRAQLSQMRPQSQPQPAPTEPQTPEKRAAAERKPRMFEYVGRTTLSVRGAVSGRTYRFTFPGQRVEVAYEDSFAMMAERNVRPARLV